MVLKLFEAGLGSSVSTIIVSKVAVVRLLRICYCVLACVKKERDGTQMLSTTRKMVQKHETIAKGGLRELHNHHIDARGTKHGSPPRLHQWHKLENACTKNFFWIFYENSSQWTPRARVNGPPVRKKKHGPLCQCPPPPLSKEETWPGPLTGGGRGGGRYPPPPVPSAERGLETNRQCGGVVGAS